MGSPEFATQTLIKLIKNGNNIIAVYTKGSYNRDGLKKCHSVVHNIALDFSLNVMTPQTLQTDLALRQFKLMAPDIVVVAAYGLLIPKEFLEIPRYGFINIHPSDLPRWRGATPMQHTIMAGDKKTAVCVIQMDEGLDTGDIILREEINLNSNITIQKLSEQCSEVGSNMVLRILNTLKYKNILLTKQSNVGVKYAKKITSIEGKLIFSITAYEVNKKIRALNPNPGTYFVYKGENIKIISSTIEESSQDYQCGTVVDDRLGIACRNSILRPTLLQRSGRKMLYTDAFLRGFDIPKGSELH